MAPATSPSTMAPATSLSLGSPPPDGGWGWAVVLAAFISIGLSYALPKSLTIYFQDIREHFSVSFSEIAWMSSIMLAAMYAGGPVSSVLVNRYGSRPVVMVGGLMVGIAMTTASFSRSITHLYLCVGVIGGFGLSFNLQPSLAIIGKYFLIKRPMANGLAMAGSPVFLSALAPLNQFLSDRFGWRGSFLILGALLLNCCVAGALMRPVSVKKKRRTTSSALCERATPEKGSEVSPPSSTLRGEHTEPQESPPSSSLRGKHTEPQKSLFVDLSVFKHRGFLIYLVGNVFMFFGFFAPVVFLAPYARHRGTDEYSAAFLLSIFALADMFARPGTGLLANTRWIRPRIQYLFSFAVASNGVCHLLCPLSTGYAGLVVYAVFFGVAFGMVCSLMFEVLNDLVGARRFSSAVGLVTVIECGPILLGPPISGTLVDIFMDYKYMYYACGVTMLLPGIFLFIMNYFNYQRLDQEEKLRQSQAEAGSRQSQAEAEVRQSQAEAGSRQSQAEAGVRQSQAEAGRRQSQAEAGRRQSQAEAEVRQSQTEAEVRQSQAEAGRTQSQAEAGRRQSQAEAELRQSQAEAGVRQSQAEAEVRQSQAELRQSQAVDMGATKRSVAEDGEGESEV